MSDYVIYKGHRMFIDDVLVDLAQRVSELESKINSQTVQPTLGDDVIPTDCDVRKILLRVVPGDGDGYEVYAKNVSDVENLLCKLGQRLEDFELASTLSRSTENCK